LLVAAVIVATLLSSVAYRGREDRDAERKHKADATKVIASLAGGYAQTEAVLATANALVDVDGTVDEARLETFAQVLFAPGVASALAFEPVVLDSDRARFEASTGITIIDRAADGSFVRAPRRDVYFPVLSVQSRDPAATKVVGFDIGQDPGRGDTARLARATGQAKLTPIVALAPTNRAGFLIIQPVKRPDDQVAGFITVGYVGETVGASIATGLQPSTQIRITDSDQRLFESASDFHAKFSENLPIGGRTWRFDFDTPADASRSVSLSILIGGLTLAALMAVAAALTLQHERGLIAARRQTGLERDLAAALALAISRAQVINTTALMVPSVATAQGVSVGLLEHGQLRVQHSPSVNPRIADRWASLNVDTRSPITDCVRTAEPLMFGKRDDVVRHYPDVEFDSSHGATALACVPLIIRGEPIGALAFGYAREQSFDEEQVRWLNQLAAMVSGALERARLHDAQAQLALTLQNDLLPEALPDTAEFTLSATYRPGDSAVVGGDWYDAFELGDGRLAITIGDVAGRGVHSAASMGKIRHVLRACAGAYREPAQVMTNADRLIWQGSRDVFATACYLTLDPTGRCEMAVAGHLPPLHVHGQHIELVDVLTGPPLGATATSLYRQVSFDLEPGACIVLYTDGLVERRDEPIDVSLDRMRDTVRAAGPSIDANSLADAMGENARDDVAILLVRRRP
jgi:sigma-B regulation protein RsbU (phosphoserine phosphatase)